MKEKITIEQYVQQKLSQRIAEQELRIHELEFMVFALREQLGEKDDLLENEEVEQ